MGIIRAISKIIFQAATGFFTGVLVIMTIIVGLFFFQRYQNELAGLPIVQELTDTYKEGLKGLGDMASIAVKEFYESRITEQFQLQIIDDQKDAPSGFVGNEQLVIPSTWNKDNLLEKLQRRGFSKKKMEQAQRYVDYIEQYKDLALRDMVDLKVLASIKLAQGILESNAGESRLSVNTNNHFGIKARPGKSARTKIKQKRFEDLRDDEFIVSPPAIGAFNYYDDNRYDRFEVYHSVRDSYRRHTQLLTRDCKTGNTGCYSWIWKSYPVGSHHDITDAALAFKHRSHIAPKEFYNGSTNVPYYAACAAGLKMAGYATNKRYHKQLSYIIDTYELWRFDLDLIRAVTK